MKKVLITGGAGFIGSHLVDSQIKAGNQVIVVDNFSVGHRSNLAQHRGNPHLHLVDADITDLNSISHWFADVHTVFHLAARADIVPSIENPLLYHRANVEGTVNVLEASRAAKVERFLYAASSSCYGIPSQYPTPESSPIQPQYPYALTKYLGEECVMHWGKVYRLPVVSLRFFNVYGPRVRTTGTYGAVFGVFLAQKVHGRPFTVVGDGTQTRDFTYVSDVVSALEIAEMSQLSQAIFNVGSGNTYSVNRLVELLDGPVEHIPKRPGEPACTFADVTKIRRELGWSPSVSLEDGVARMLEDLELWKKAPLWDSDSIARATEKWFEFLS